MLAEDEVMATTLLDRLRRRSRSIYIEGQSFGVRLLDTFVD